MVELPKTEAELQALLDAKANEITESLNAKHNSDMASLRKKHESDLARAKEQANMTAEQIAEQRYKEQQEADQKELVLELNKEIAALRAELSTLKSP